MPQPLCQWVLTLANTNPPLYLRKYLAGTNYLTTADTREAESFTRAIDAIEMSRRVSHLTRVKWEAVSVPSGEPLCALAGCPHPQAVDSTMCPIHRDMGYRKAAEQMAGRIKAEAAMMTEPHQAVADALNNAIAAFDPDGEDSDQDCHFYATRTPTGTIEVKEEP